MKKNIQYLSDEEEPPPQKEEDDRSEQKEGNDPPVKAHSEESQPEEGSADSDAELGFQIDVKPAERIDEDNEEKSDEDDFEKDLDKLPESVDPPYLEHFPQLELTLSDDDETCEDEKYKNFFDIDILTSLRSKLLEPSKESPEDDILKVKSVSEIQDDWFDPKDSLLNLIPRDKLIKLRKYVEGNITPSEDSRVKRALKDVVTKNLEAQTSLPPLTEKERKKRNPKEDTAGVDWANLPRTELSDEVKEHFRIVKNRNALYRDKFTGAPKGDLYPQYSVMGTILPDPRDARDRNLPTKKKTLLREVMEDEESREWLTRKYGDIQDERWQPTRPDKKRKLRKLRMKHRKRAKLGKD